MWVWVRGRGCVMVWVWVWPCSRKCMYGRLYGCVGARVCGRMVVLVCVFLQGFFSKNIMFVFFVSSFIKNFAQHKLTLVTAHHGP